MDTPECAQIAIVITHPGGWFVCECGLKVDEHRAEVIASWSEECRRRNLAVREGNHYPGG